MTIALTLALVICILGLLIYLLADPSKNPRVVEVGRIAYQIGLFVFLFCGCSGSRVVAGILTK